MNDIPPKAADTRASWDIATQNHNAHKGDQAARLREGYDTLFDEELDFLGELEGKRLVHLQCNSGQDSLCLARRGAVVTGVDFSGVAIRFARELSNDASISATFLEHELLSWLASTELRFPIAFSSYGTVSWMPDLAAWARGIERILEPGGAFVLIEFHPLMWSIGETGALDQDDYFFRGPYVAPVEDYVADAGPALGASVDAPRGKNLTAAHGFQYGLAETVQSLVDAGLVLTRLAEWPHSHGATRPGMVALDERRWGMPPGRPRVPLMFGLRVRKPVSV